MNLVALWTVDEASLEVGLVIIEEAIKARFGHTKECMKFVGFKFASMNFASLKISSSEIRAI